jgi:uncharacterized delta-60 repeat protein
MWLFSRKLRHPVRRPSRRPNLEVLEDRCVPSAGALDTTFGSGGIVTTSLDHNNDYANGALLQPNGDSIVYGGNGMARYTPNGSLDSSFGSGGIVLRPPSWIAMAALQTDGKIVAAGGSSLFRYNANGTLDKTFGSKGVVAYPSGWGAGPGIVIEPATGDIVLEGSPSAAPDDIGLLRYTPNGVLDTTFGQGGKVATPFPGMYSADLEWNTLALENGHIVEAGFVSTGGPNPNSRLWFLARYNDDGTLDTTFGPSGTGLVTTAVGYGLSPTMVRSLVVQPNGEIVAVGVAENSLNSPQEWALARYTTAGILDGTFGNGGIVTSSFTAGGDEPWNAALQANGQIVVAGFNDGSPQIMEVGRYNSDGSLDTTFGSGGFVSTPFASQSAAVGVLIQPDGKIVAAGYTTINGKVDYMLARYLPSEPEIGSFTANPNPVTSGSTTTLTVSNITDGNPNSTITQVAFFYYDNTGAPHVLGYGTQTSPGVWTLNYTVNLSAGTYTIYAQDEDSYGVFGDPFALTLTVQ